MKKIKSICLWCMLFTMAALSIAKAQSPEIAETIADTVFVQGKPFVGNNLPASYRVDRDLGLLIHKNITGQVIHKNYEGDTHLVGGLYETRATITPKGDYLLMFPNGGHYGGAGRNGLGKVNDMVAYRSSDKGKTWEGPTIAFDIDYNQHGFIPLIPKGQERIYAFGTQPIPELYEVEDGLHENTPIGYRYSDDDGYTWSEVRIIRPVNDPDFRGMSVMRMTETDQGTWILGSHEGDWSYRPLVTRQYLLRSEDQGKTWEVLPGKRHGGWYAPGFNRMDEGRPINLGDGEVYFMARTTEGHLWHARSMDDGKTWSDPKPSPLVHPDAPPMLFKLSDGKTLIALHHNRFSPKEGGFNFKDRSEIWFSLSEDGGRTWSEPRFLFANALAETLNNAFRNYQCSYIDMINDNGKIHLFVPHRWQRAMHLTFDEKDLKTFPTKNEIIK